MYDRENELIGLVSASTRATNAYPLVAHKDMEQKHRIIRANRFCRHYGIKVAATTSFNRPEIDDEGVMVLDMRDARRVGRQ